MLLYITEFFKRIDWILFSAVMCIVSAGLVTMNSFTSIQGNVIRNTFFNHQIIALSVALCVFFVSAMFDWRFLKDTRVITTFYSVLVGMLVLLFISGKVFKGAQSWFSFGAFSFQPGDLAELAVILVLSKYFSRRHVEIAHIRHIIVSGFYAFIIFLLVFLQPDFGSAVIVFTLWFGMVLVSGISKKHIVSVFSLGIITFFLLWGLVFRPYQKDRILNFIHPLTHIRGTGYNAYQSTIAVGSGQLFGKGVGGGSQSRLQYLPEYQTDFVFAAFAEEWGFVGVIILFVLLAIVFGRMLLIARKAGSNFEMLFGVGLTMLFTIHATINIGTNIGLLPVTGNTLPFMSYGGSHLVTEFLGLGILMSVRRHGRVTHREKAGNEIVGTLQ